MNGWASREKRSACIRLKVFKCEVFKCEVTGALAKRAFLFLLKADSYL